MFCVLCSDSIVFEAELEEGHVDQWLVVTKQRINSIAAPLVIFCVFFEESKGNTHLDFLGGFDILGFNFFIKLFV